MHRFENPERQLNKCVNKMYLKNGQNGVGIKNTNTRSCSTASKSFLHILFNLHEQSHIKSAFFLSDNITSRVGFSLLYFAQSTHKCSSFREKTKRNPARNADGLHYKITVLRTFGCGDSVLGWQMVY